MSTIQRNDYSILANIFLPRPNGSFFTHEKRHESALKTLIVEGKIAPESPTNFISLAPMPTPPGFKCSQFDFIKSPDGSIRWIYPAGLESPTFIKLYNGSGWRGFTVKNALRAAFSLGAKNWVKSGSLYLLHQDNLWLGELASHAGASNYAIFTGTMGDNRKAVIALAGQHGTTWFYKLPMTLSAQDLVTNEHTNLVALKSLPLEKIHFPTSKPIGNGLLLSDVKPKLGSNSSRLLPLHLEAIQELTSSSLQVNPLEELPSWREVGLHISALENQPILNGLPDQTVSQIINRLKELRASFPSNQIAPTAMAHGDLTPWNCYLGAGKLHVYDWEMAGRKSLLYDAFHFIFQTGILIKRQPLSQIKKELKALQNMPITQQILAGQPMNFQRLYQLYLLQVVSYYLLKYIQQQPLHQQAKWLVGTWHEALLQDD